jgi:hypothetical protein
MDEVVAIQHITKSGDKVYDGSGIVIPYGRNSLLITCKHVMNKEKYNKHFFNYCEQEYTIDQQSGLKASPYQPLPKDGEVFHDDYAFIEVTSSCKSKLQLGNSAEIELKDEIVLLAHDQTNGNQIMLRGVRRNDKGYALHEWKDGNSYRGLNTMSIDVDGIVCGYSGGAIIHSPSGKCVGILKGRERDFERFDSNCFYMIRAETFIERYEELKNASV